MKKIKCMSSILVVICLLFAISLFYSPQKIELATWEKSCLTNAVYRLSGSDVYTDEQRELIAKSVLNLRGNNESEWNVVDVLERHPEIYGEWHEKDVQRYTDVNAEEYARAENIVLKYVK